GLQVIPADLVLRMPAHRCAEHMRQQLRAEADAQHRLALAQCRFDGLQFSGQVWITFLLIHIHRATQHDQPAIAIDAGLRIRIALEIVEADAVSARADARIERAQRFSGHMLAHPQTRRGGYSRAPVTTARSTPRRSLASMASPGFTSATSCKARPSGPVTMA